MRKPLGWLVVIAVAVLGTVMGLSFADSPPSPWVSPASPTLLKTSDLPDSTPPSQSNIDCDLITTRMAYSRLMQNDCVMQTPLGLAGNNGIIFTGSSQLVPIVPPSPFDGLRPMPNQPMLYTYTSASSTGSYMGIYTSIRDKMKPIPDLVNGGYRYTLTKGPDFILKSLAGKSQPVNTQSVAFSPNGDWMVVDFPFQGFVRVNLATFEIMPFTSSMNVGMDTSAYTAQLAISNDGRYVALRPGSQQAFRVYDVDSCAKAVLPYDPTQAKCQSRDYWADLSSQLPKLQALYQPRFTSSMQLSVTAQYDYSSSGYKVAEYSLTAPGVSPMGIEYLGMGDSYASGQGAFNYIAGTDTPGSGCHLSSLSYPYLISAGLFNSGHSVACSGAVTDDIAGARLTYKGQNVPHNTSLELSQLGLLDSILDNYSPGYILQSDFVEKYNPQNITLSISGNDIGFQDIVTRCVTPSIANSTCYPTKEDQQELVDRILNVQSKLQATYRALKGPGRRIYVIGYPQIVVNGGNCANNVHLNADEIKMFIDLTNLLNSTIQRSAAQESVHYVDVSDAFAGHRLCETKSSSVAVNGLTAGNDTGGFIKTIGAESYHPNVLGHELLKQAILKQTNSFKSYNTTSTGTLSSQLPYSTAPATGRTVNLTITDNDLTTTTLPSLGSVAIRIDSTTAQLKSSSPFNFKLDDISLGTANSDATGLLAGNISLPGEVACGPHTLHVYGQNIIGEPLDVYKEVYVSTTTGCGEVQNKCGIVSDSGMDEDKDGTDDACDPFISDAPPLQSQAVYLTGSSLHITNK